MRKNTILRLTTALLPCYLLSTTIAQANDDPIYQIEMVVFSRLSPSTLASEKWPSINPAALKINPADPSQYQQYLKAINWKLQSPSHYFMNPLIKTLKQSNYNILMHMAWQQQVGPTRYSQPIQLYGGKAYSLSAEVQNVTTDETTPFEQYPQWQINGNLKISVNRYFNLHFNLIFAEPLTTIQTIDSNGYFDSVHSPFVYFHLNQNRRTRSNELNYIDFPLYGVMFEIKKIT